MLEKPYLKSEFYSAFLPDQTFSNNFQIMPVANDISVACPSQNQNILTENKMLNTNTHGYNLLNKCKHFGDNGVTSPRKDSLRNSLNTCLRSLLDDEFSEEAISDKNATKSFQGIKKNDSEDIPKNSKISRGNKDFIKPQKKIEEYQRVKTPSFNKNTIQNVDDLKRLCNKLIAEQEIMKNKLKNQQKIIIGLNRNKYNTPIKPRSNFPLISKIENQIRSASIQKPQSKGYENNSDQVKFKERSSMTPNSPSSMKLHNSLISPVRANNDEYSEYPLMLLNRLDKFLSNSRVSPSKYYKDQPKIKNVFRFPKDVFTPK